MQQLVLDKKTAIKLFPTASTEFKTMLEESFGKEAFSGKITDRVKSYEDACEVLGITPRSFSSDMTADEVAYVKVKTIIQALNEGWKPDWSNHSQYKYYARFYMEGFSFSDYHRWHTYSHAGSRLCFKSAELAEYAGKQFHDLYKDLFIIQ